jgi:hypothetical protein
MNGLGKSFCLGLFLLCIGPLHAAAQATNAPSATPAPVQTLVPPSRTSPEPTAEPAAARAYALGDRGTDVLALKLRLQALGYFKAGTELSDKVTDKTLERVNQFLQDSGMEPVEIITTDIQTMIFTRDDLAIVPTPTPQPTLQPLIAPVGTPELPELTEEGFLPDADGEFLFTDDADGLWYYISDTLYLNIRRYNDREEENIWYETEVKTRGGEQLQSLLTHTYYTYRSPVAIAREHDAVLAFTDDYFAMRSYGVVIRDGEIVRDVIRKSSKSYPLADSLAVFPDGSMRAFDYDACTAEEFLAMGAAQVLSFGPWLLQNGEINARVTSDDYMHYKEPRCALGMIEPGHYFILTVDGRYDGADGVYIGWLAQRMQEVGVTEALNLDGGGTTALVFMGLQISRVASDIPDGTRSRRVSSMMGFGVSDTVPN